MRVYSSTQPLYNLLSPLINSRFTVAFAAISESIGKGPDKGFHSLNSPIYQDHGCNLLPACLTCPLSTCKDDLDPEVLRRELRFLQNLQAASRAAAQVGE